MGASLGRERDVRLLGAEGSPYQFQQRDRPGIVGFLGLKEFIGIMGIIGIIYRGCNPQR